MIISNPETAINTFLCCEKFVRFSFDLSTGQNNGIVAINERIYSPELEFSDFDLNTLTFKIVDENTTEAIDLATPLTYAQFIALNFVEAGKFIFLETSDTTGVEILFSFGTVDSSVNPCGFEFESQFVELGFLTFAMRKINPAFDDYNLRVFNNSNTTNSAIIYFNDNGDIADDSPTIPFISNVAQPETTFAAWRASQGIGNGITGTAMRVSEWKNQTGSTVIASQTNNGNRPYLIQDSTFGGRWKIEFGRITGGVTANTWLQTPAFGLIDDFVYDSFSLMVLCKSNRTLAAESTLPNLVTNERIIAKQATAPNNGSPIIGGPNSGKTGLGGAIRELVLVGVTSNTDLANNTRSPFTADANAMYNYTTFVENQNPNGTGYANPAIVSNIKLIQHITNISAERSATVGWNTDNATANIPVQLTNINHPSREHIVVSSLEFAGGGRMDLYCNGYLEHTATGFTNDRTNSPFRIGGVDTTFIAPYVGNIAEVRLYKRKLSGAETLSVTQDIATYYNISNVKP